MTLAQSPSNREGISTAQQNQSQSFQTGQHLAQRYELVELLAEHDNRQTWIALDLEQSPPQQVVVKCLMVRHSDHWQSLKLFERESQVLQALDHPQIPDYRDFFELEKGFGFGLVQEHIPGKSLKQLLNEGQHFEPEAVKAMAQSLLEILNYLHQLSPPVLHRDIKPSNIMIGEGDRIYLVDFGAVQIQAPTEGQTFTVVGTYGYAPMEQYGGRAVASSDLYSLGTTLIHLLTGVAPMNLPQDDQGIQFQQNTSAERSFVNWLTKLSHPQLNRRFQTTHDALESLEQGLPDPVARDEAFLARPYGSRIHIESGGDCLTVNIPAADDSLIPLLGDLIMAPVIVVLHGIVLGGATMMILSVIVLFFFKVTAAVAMHWLYGGSLLIAIALLKVFVFPTLSQRFDPYRSLTLKSDGQILSVHPYPGGSSRVALKDIKQIYANDDHICLGIENKRIKIGTGLGLSVEELEWLAEALDQTLRSANE